jgi:hypothetical protein
MSLFPAAPKELCEDIGLPWRSAVKLYKDGLISFDPEETAELNEPQIAELSFVGSLVAAGCTTKTLQELLSGLKKPYCYSHRAIYYHWPSREWKRMPEAAEDPDEFRPSPMWRVIPKFPRHPSALTLFTGPALLSREYAAAIQWLDRLGEAEDMETLKEMLDRIVQILDDLKDHQETEGD